MSLVLEQALNGVQLGVTLFLLAAGLTLVFGIMGVINLAHGSLYMVGAYAAAYAAKATGSFLLAVPAGLAAAAVTGMVVEYIVVRKLYARDHLDQVLATFGLILFFNQVDRAAVRTPADVRADVRPRCLAPSISGCSPIRSTGCASSPRDCSRPRGSSC